MDKWIQGMVANEGQDWVHIRIHPRPDGLSIGDEIVVRIRKPRNPKHHRKYWGMLRRVVDATGFKWQTPEKLHDWIRVQTGQYHANEVINGRVVIELKPTDFMAMAQDEFAEFYNLAVECIAWETGIDPEALGRSEK